jgi:hypothetical protein
MRVREMRGRHGHSDSVDDIKAKLAEAEEFLESLRSGTYILAIRLRGAPRPRWPTFNDRSKCTD